MYWAVVCGQIAWALLSAFVAIEVFPTAVYWISYYVVDYHLGFVRRGLAGEILAMVPTSSYISAAHVLMWIPPLVWTAALGWLIWLILSTCRRSERRIMLALLVPVLPFGFFYGVNAPRPELLGMAALVVFAGLLTRQRSSRNLTWYATVYGLTIAVLAFVHEAIPLELTLGVLLAVSVLGSGITPNDRRIIGALALTPGYLATLAVAVFGRRDLAVPLCTDVPHGILDNPYGALTTPTQILEYVRGNLSIETDYHTWVCTNVLQFLDMDTADGMRSVADLGLVGLLASFGIGVLLLVSTTCVIGYFSGVAPATFVQLLRSRKTVVLCGLAAMVPVFATGLDWLRWWVVITCCFTVVYLLYAIARPEVDTAPPPRSVRLFVIAVVVLGLLPIGQHAHIGGNTFRGTPVDTAVHPAQ